MRLHVVEWGDSDGSPVLILHGGAHAARVWESVCRRLPHGIRCIVPDQRGHGQSEWSEEGDYSCASQAADLLGLLDALEIGRCVMVGHSMGGLNALELAGGNPERVRGLVLVDVGTETADTGLERVRRKHRESRGEDAAERAASADATGQTPGFDVRLLPHVPTYCGDAEYRRELLSRVGAPLLVLRGEYSRIMPRARAVATANLVGGSVVDIPGTGHDVPNGNPDATAEALRSFVAQLDRQA